MKTSTVPRRKKMKKVTLPGTNVTGHFLEIERTFDDNMFQNAVAQLLNSLVKSVMKRVGN